MCNLRAVFLLLFCRTIHVWCMFPTEPQVKKIIRNSVHHPLVEGLVTCEGGHGSLWVSFFQQEGDARWSIKKRNCHFSVGKASSVSGQIPLGCLDTFASVGGGKRQ